MKEMEGANNSSGIPIPFLKFFAHPTSPIKHNVGNCQVDNIFVNSVPYLVTPSEISVPLDVTKQEMVDHRNTIFIFCLLSSYTQEIFNPQIYFFHSWSTISPSKKIGVFEGGI